MIIGCGKPDGSGLVFCESFRSRQLIQSRGGALVGCAVGDNGIKPTAASSRVTFAGTENLLNLVTQFTLSTRFRTPVAAPGGSKHIVGRFDNAFVDAQWALQYQISGLVSPPSLTFYVAITGATVASARLDVALSQSTEYLVHTVVNCSNAMATRVVMYVNGVAPVQSNTSTLPTIIRQSSTPLTVLNRSAGSTLAPDNDFVLRSVRIYDKAWSAEEVLDDYHNDTYVEVFGGGP